MVNFNPKFAKTTTPAGDPSTEISDVPRACWEHESPDGRTVKDIFIELQNRIRGVYIAWSPEDEKPSMTIDVIERDHKADPLSDDERVYLNTVLNRFRSMLLKFVAISLREETEPKSSLAMIPLVPTIDHSSDTIDLRRRFEAISNLRRKLGEFLRSKGFQFKFVRVRDTGSKPRATFVDFFAKDLLDATRELKNFEVTHGKTFDERYQLKLIEPDDPENKEGVYLLIVERKIRPSS